MKTIKKLKLNQLSKADLEKKQMNAIKGGAGCICIGCGCMGYDGSTQFETDNWKGLTLEHLALYGII